MSDVGKIDDDMPGYRQLSKTAVVAFAAALFGLLGLLIPMLSAIAVLAAILAAIALHRVSNSDGLLAGGRLASIALLLSLGVLGTTVGYQVTKASRMVALAREKAEQWFAKVANGDRYAAHQLMLPVSERIPQGVDLNTYYALGTGDDLATPAPRAAVELEAAFNEPDVKRLIDHLESGTSPRFHQALAIKSSGYFYDVELEYEMPGAGFFLVGLRRELKPETRRTFWQFNKVQWKLNE